MISYHNCLFSIDQLTDDRVDVDWTLQWGVELYLRIFVFSVPDVGAGPHAVVSIVARRLMYPLPAQIFPEVDVQAPHAAGLCLTAWEKTGNVFCEVCDETA